VASISDGGELQMSDGSVIGHRGLRTYYKQKLKPSRDAGHTQLIASLLANYRALALEGYGGGARTQRSERTMRINQMAQKQHMKIGMIHNTQKHYRRQINE